MRARVVTLAVVAANAATVARAVDAPTPRSAADLEDSVAAAAAAPLTEQQQYISGLQLHCNRSSPFPRRVGADGDIVVAMSTYGTGGWAPEFWVTLVQRALEPMVHAAAAGRVIVFRTRDRDAMCSADLVVT
jgi:hypothetical protein